MHPAGTLAPVGELTAVPVEGFLHHTWNPPFTLNITNIEPDIFYCINVYNITPNSLYKTYCDLTQPEFDFMVANPIPCDQFQFQVIPVNGLGNGTLNNISGSLFNSKLWPLMVYVNKTRAWGAWFRIMGGIFMAYAQYADSFPTASLYSSCAAQCSCCSNCCRSWLD